MPISASKFRNVYQTDTAKLIVVIREGLPAVELALTSKAMQRSNDHLCHMLRFAPTTIRRKIRKGETLSPEQSERLIGLQRLIGQVETMLDNCGTDDPSFDARLWLADWLDRRIRALGGKKGADYMDTMMGQELVSNLLAQIEAGSYS